MTELFDALTAPEVRPFFAAAGIVFALAIIEILALLTGFSLSELIGKEFGDKDADVDANHSGWLDGLIIWINPGRVPLLVLIILMLGIFAIEGFLLHAIARGVGLPAPAWATSLLAIAGMLPVVRWATRGIARIIPRDETYVVSQGDFIGRIGVVAIGPLDQGLPGQVRLKDIHGNWHSLVARASPDSPPLAVGSGVLLVDRDARSFIAISAPADLTVSHTNRT